MCQNRWSPFDGMNLGHEGAVDDPGFVEDLIAG